MAQKFKVAIKVSDIPKDKVYEGKKGKYVYADLYIDEANPGQYGDVGSLSIYNGKGEKRTFIGNIQPIDNKMGDVNNEKPLTEDDLPF